MIANYCVDLVHTLENATSNDVECVNGLSQSQIKLPYHTTVKLSAFKWSQLPYSGLIYCTSIQMRWQSSEVIHFRLQLQECCEYFPVLKKKKKKKAGLGLDFLIS